MLAKPADRRCLLLVRHAKASRADPTLPDRDRPLTGRGKRDAEQAARRIVERGLRPDQLLSSPARRALKTARIFARVLAIPRAQILIDERLYAQPLPRLMQLVRGLDDRLVCVMLFGHNPQLSALAQQLAPRLQPLSTSAVVRLRFRSGRWTEVDAAALTRATVESVRNR